MAYQKRTWLARIGSGLNKFIIGDKDANNKQTLTNSPDSVTQQGDVISADNLNDLENRIEAGFTADATAIGTKADKTYVDNQLATKQNTLTFDNVPTSGSSNPVKSGGVYSALAGKQNTLTFDDAPTNGSNNPVKSGGIYTALGGKISKLTKIWENSNPSAVFNAQSIPLTVEGEAIVVEYYATYDNPEMSRAMKVLHYGANTNVGFTLDIIRATASYIYVHIRGVTISKASASSTAITVAFDDSDLWALSTSGNSQYTGGGRNCTPIAIYKVDAF